VTKHLNEVTHEMIKGYQFDQVVNRKRDFMSYPILSIYFKKNTMYLRLRNYRKTIFSVLFLFFLCIYKFIYLFHIVVKICSNSFFCFSNVFSAPICCMGGGFTPVSMPPQTKGFVLVECGNNFMCVCVCVCMCVCVM